MNANNRMLSERTARRFAQEIEMAKPLIDILIRDVPKSFVSYRKVGQKKTFSALIDTSADHDALLDILSGLAGDPVEFTDRQG